VHRRPARRLEPHPLRHAARPKMKQLS
jgi:hypothetical protein